MRKRSTPFTRMAQRHLRTSWPGLLLLGTLLIGGMAFTIAGPQILGRFIDTVGASAVTWPTWIPAVLFVAVGVGARLCSTLAVLVGENQAWRATNRFRDELLRHALKLELSFFNHHGPGELVQRIDDDTAAVGNLMSRMLLQVLGNVILLVAVAAVLLLADARLAAMAVAYMLVTLLVLAIIRPAVVRAWGRERKVAAQLSALQQEILRAQEDIRASAAVHHVRGRLESTIQRAGRAFRSAFVAGASNTAATQLLHMLGYAAVLVLALHLHGRGAITVGTVYMALHYTVMLSGPLEAVRVQVADLGSASASVSRMNWLLGQQAPAAAGCRQLLPGPLEVAFNSVSYRYPDDRRPALSDVSFMVPAGTTLGILGRTGGGKTTLTRLLLGLAHPTAGTVSIGGLALETVEPRHLRSRVRLVTQGVRLFSATVRQNLTLFGDDVADHVLTDALAAVGLDQWLLSLPQGLDTHLTGGTGMSAGHAQLLALARAFISAPSVIILDEASARLDPSTAAAVTGATDLLLSGRTGIVIAHRLETLRRCDQVMIIRHGVVQELGPEPELAADPGSVYGALLRLEEEE